MDKLKHYLREHRASLDVEMPPANLWQPIQVQLVAQAAKAMLIKWIIGIGIAAVIGTGTWLTIHKQKPTHTPATAPAPVPVTPPKEIILKDTVPDTPAQSVPVVKPKKKKLKTPPPAPPVIHKHKKSPDTTVHPIKPRPKKKAIRPMA